MPTNIFCALFIAILCAFIAEYFLSVNIHDVNMCGGFKDVDSHQAVEDIDPFFDKLDTNKDGVLSLDEFKKLEEFLILLEKMDDEKFLHFEDFEEEYIPGDSNVTLQALFTPLDLKSLTKRIESRSPLELKNFDGLLSWKTPSKNMKNFSDKAFSILMPQLSHPISPGYYWQIINSKALDEKTKHKVYSPKSFPKQFRPLHYMLKMFHPRPFLWTRFGPQGTVGVLKAVGESFYDIVFRMHAEFQLQMIPSNPFWFTPAQFDGRLLISKDGKKVHYFHLEVPNCRKLNVDMEWIIDPADDSMEVDIGFMPKMRLETVGQQNVDTILEELYREDQNDVVSIPMEEANDIIEKVFFPFKQVKYHNISEGVKEAEAQKKLLHGLVLWGSLDDQSC